MLNFIIEGGITEINLIKGNVSERNTESVCVKIIFFIYNI